MIALSSGKSDAYSSGNNDEISICVFRMQKNWTFFYFIFIRSYLKSSTLTEYTVFVDNWVQGAQFAFRVGLEAPF